MKYLIALLLLLNLLKAEPANSALKKMETNKKFIIKACSIFNVNPKILSAIILTERTLNYDWMDDALDVLLAKSGWNMSIGFCQVKLKTAYWIEKQLADSTSEFFPGLAYFSKLPVSKSPREIISKLSDDSLNISYSAAYIRIILSYWEKSDYPISERPAIIGTLYSTGLFLPNGKIRKPKKRPSANFFGKRVLQYFK